MEHASATKFRQYVMHGDWIKADHYLQEVQQLIERKQNNIVVSINLVIPSIETFFTEQKLLLGFFVTFLHIF